MESNLSAINVHQVREKIDSKKELYDFLTQECNAYLPKMTCTNKYFIKSILNGEKVHMKRSDVILSAIPQIEGLSVENFIDFEKISLICLNIYLTSVIGCIQTRNGFAMFYSVRIEKEQVK